MKMKMRTMELYELQALYTQPAVRPEGDGYYLRKVGRSNFRVNPNLQIHVPCMGLPLENGEPINLLRGFTEMPRLREVMNLDSHHKASFLFCKRFYTIYESGIHEDICHIDICDPSEAQYILIITAFADEPELFSKEDPAFTYGKGWWSGYTHKRSRHPEFIDRYTYSLVPIGFRDTPEGEEQTLENIERVKSEVVRLANEYLGIEDEGYSIEPKTTESPTANETDSEIFRSIPIGLEPGEVSVTLWAYSDDISTDDCWVIDQHGRLLKPTAIKDYRGRFLDESVEVAEERFWQNIPETALALAWSKHCTASEHIFDVIVEADRLTTAQRERVAMLEKNIEKAYCNKTSPYNGEKSPGIGNGWNLWDHGVYE